MKRLVKLIMPIFLASLSLSVSGKQNNLNIYIWGNYLPYEVIAQFTKETGIKVNLTEFDNNETMFAKLKASKNPGYDIVVPSSYFVERMAKLGMLYKLDKTKLTNLRYINPSLLNKKYDVNNNYSVPYLWGSVGIIVNSKYFNKRNITSWKDFWDKKYKDQLMMLNDMRDAFGMALLALGYSINDRNPDHIKSAYLKLKELLPNIKIFNIDTVPNIYIDEDAMIGMAWSGDSKLAIEENPSLVYIYPKDGFSIWIDNFAILKDAPNIDNAQTFINFMLRPEIAKQVTIAIGHTTANKAAIKLLPLKYQQNAIDNPEATILRRGEIQLDLDEETRQIYERYWERLKIND